MATLRPDDMAFSTGMINYLTSLPSQSTLKKRFPEDGACPGRGLGGRLEARPWDGWMDSSSDHDSEEIQSHQRRLMATEMNEERNDVSFDSQWLEPLDLVGGSTRRGDP